LAVEVRNFFGKNGNFKLAKFLQNFSEKVWKKVWKFKFGKKFGYYSKMYVNFENFKKKYVKFEFLSQKDCFGSKSLEKVRKSLESLEILKIVLFRNFQKLQKMTLNLNFGNREKLVPSRKPTRTFG